MEPAVKIGLIGAGYWGKNLLRNFYKLGVLDTVCEKNDLLLNEIKQEYPGLKCTDNEDQLINNKEIQGIVIASPAVTHYTIARKVLVNNKDVFVEKPLALDMNEGEKLVELAQRNNRILMVGHILQYHPAVIKLKELIDNGELGKIHYIYSNRLNIGKLRNEENILWSFAPHDISIILMLINKFPKEIQAQGGDYIQHRIYDVTMTNFKFDNHVQGHIFVSWLHPFKEQKLVVVGDKKMAVFNDMAVNKLELFPHKIEWKNQIPVAQKAEAEIIPVADEEPLKNECQAFINSIQTRKQPKTNGVEGLQVLKFLKLAEESMKTRVPNINNPEYYVHPTAVAEEGAQIGRNTKIWHFCHVMKGAKIGDNCNIGQNVYIDKRAIIGNNVKIQNNVSVYDDVILEDGVFCGPSMVFTNVINPRSFIERKHEYKKTLVKKGASIGANATIVCGNTIGKYAFVGAGSVVTKDIPDYALVVGVPAKITGWFCKCGNKLKITKTKAVCPQCRNEYKFSKHKIEPLKEK